MCAGADMIRIDDCTHVTSNRAHRLLPMCAVLIRHRLSSRCSMRPLDVGAVSAIRATSSRTEKIVTPDRTLHRERGRGLFQGLVPAKADRDAAMQMSATHLKASNEMSRQMPAIWMAKLSVVLSADRSR
jgi:hypothetical protein